MSISSGSSLAYLLPRAIGASLEPRASALSGDLTLASGADLAQPHPSLYAALTTMWLGLADALGGMVVIASGSMGGLLLLEQPRAAQCDATGSFHPPMQLREARA